MDSYPKPNPVILMRPINSAAPSKQQNAAVQPLPLCPCTTTQVEVPLNSTARKTQPELLVGRHQHCQRSFRFFIFHFKFFGFSLPSSCCARENAIPAHQWIASQQSRAQLRTAIPRLHAKSERRDWQHNLSENYSLQK